jgi:hypothetical protein
MEMDILIYSSDSGDQCRRVMDGRYFQADSMLYLDRKVELWPSVFPADRRTRVGFYRAFKIMQKQGLAG